jgi:hypothetical protein
MDDDQILEFTATLTTIEKTVTSVEIFTLSVTTTMSYTLTLPVTTTATVEKQVTIEKRSYTGSERQTWCR